MKEDRLWSPRNKGLIIQRMIIREDVDRVNQERGGESKGIHCPRASSELSTGAFRAAGMWYLNLAVS